MSDAVRSHLDTHIYVAYVISVEARMSLSRKELRAFPSIIQLSPESFVFEYIRGTKASFRYIHQLGHVQAVDDKLDTTSCH